MIKKVRLLDLLCQRFGASDREYYYARILCGEVIADGEKIRDPKAAVRVDADIQFYKNKYVSRGGVKLEHALNETKFPVEGLVFIDAGASAGGFTDCLLQSGAVHVHAIDVGNNQLDYRLRIDKRISVYEKTNVMSVSSLNPAADAAVADISFRTIRGAASRMLDLTKKGQLLALIKPQFEWIEPSKDFKGIVHSEKNLFNILTHLEADLRREGAYVIDVVESPITGRKGNREFFYWICEKERSPDEDIQKKIRDAVYNT